MPHLDSLTVLTSRGPLLTKRWLADGSILGTDRAKTFTAESVQFSGIEGLADALRGIAGDPTKAVIRGAIIDQEGYAERGHTTRDLENFREEPRTWACFDIDGFEPVLSDPVTEPADAVIEFIETKLPPEFSGCSHFFQLSSSAGAPGKSQYLKCHLWFLFDRPLSGPQLETWARFYKVPVDKTTLRTVQLHYVADPVIDEGAHCPVVTRSGIHHGARETVALELPDEADAWDALLHQPVGPGRTMADPGAKPGVIGAFCRAYSPARAINELLADHFTWETDEDSPRLTWAGGHGAQGGACITDDELHVYNSHDSDPFAGRAVNVWDLCRHYLFGELDGDDPSVYEFAGPTALPSDKAMRQFARTLPDVQAELPPVLEERTTRHEERTEAIEAAKEDAAAPRVQGERVRAELAAHLSLEDGVALPFDADVFDTQLEAVAWEPGRGQFKIMVASGEVLQATREDFAVVMRERFPPMHDPALLEEMARGRAAALQMNAVRTEAFVKEVTGLPYRRLAERAKAHRQFTVIDASVDVFADAGRMSLKDGRLSLLFPHERLKEGAVDPVVASDYRAHWPHFDAYLELLVATRFAGDRKAAHLWMHAPSDWGKNFLVSALARHGLVYSTSASELEKALSGGPVGLTLEGMRRVWVLFVDEFKGVTRELKQLSSELTFSPKNQARVTVPLYLKHFASAEDVPSLASPETGIEEQFANRFLYMREQGVLTPRPLFKQLGSSAYFASVVNMVAAGVNAIADRYRALGRAEAARQAEEVIAQLHDRFSLDAAVAGGAKTLESKLPEIARDFANDMVVASLSGLARGGSMADLKARSDVFEHGGFRWLRRAGAALDTWLDETYGRGEAGKLKYKRRQILEELGPQEVLWLNGGSVKARKLGIAVDPLS